MPVLEKIVISDFRNIQLQELVFSPNVNCISGNNGEGKTNLLDAIYYLSMTKSAFATSDRFNFRHGTDEFSVSGTYRMENGLSSRFSLKMSAKGEKKVRRDDKPYSKVSEHVGVLPIVMISPADISMVSESGEERRRFVNAVLSQMDREYMSAMQQYNRLLLQRNRMLKEMDPDRALLEVIDMRMAALAEPIYETRKRFVDDLQPIVAQYYRMVSGDSEQVDIEYESELSKASLDQLLEASYEKDRILKHTTSGIHRDDFIFRMNGHPIRRYGSVPLICRPANTIQASVLPQEEAKSFCAISTVGCTCAGRRMAESSNLVRNPGSCCSSLPSISTLSCRRKSSNFSVVPSG